jgi:hypothetical protein
MLPPRRSNTCLACCTGYVTMCGYSIGLHHDAQMLFCMFAAAFGYIKTFRKSDQPRCCCKFPSPSTLQPLAAAASKTCAIGTIGQQIRELYER